MARALRWSGLIALLGSGGCFHAPTTSASRAVAVWREMEAASAEAPTRGGSAAAPEGAADRSLTAEQAYQMALARNPDLAVYEAQVEVADAEIAAAKQLDNPTLRLTNFRLDNAVKGAPTMQMGVRVPIPRPGSIKAKTDGARLAAEGARAWSGEARRLLRARIYKLFARLALLQADLAHVTRAAELRAERLRMLQSRVDRAVATRLDQSLADVAHAEALDEAARLRGEVQLVEAELQQVTGAGPQAQFRVDAQELTQREPALDREALTERALGERPEIRAAQMRLGVAEAEAYLARSQTWPWLSWAQVSYYVGPNATPGSFGLGVALDLPFLSWNRGEIRAAKARVRQGQAEERAKVAAVAHEVRQALARVEQTATRVRELEKGLLVRLDAAGREAEQALAAGAIDPLQASDLEVRRIAARRLHLAAQLDHREALIDLEAAVGAALAGEPRAAADLRR